MQDNIDIHRTPTLCPVCEQYSNYFLSWPTPESHNGVSILLLFVHVYDADGGDGSHYHEYTANMPFWNSVIEPRLLQ